LKESADLPNRMIDLNWRRQYDIKQKRQRARLTTLIRRSPRPSCQSLPISDFGKRLGSAGKGFLADVGIAVADRGGAELARANSGQGGRTTR
jgi:hypothetical protein